MAVEFRMNMKRFFGKIFNGSMEFDSGEAQHMRQVLRMQVGDKIIGCVNDDNNYFCTLTEISKNKAVAIIDRVEVCPALPKKEIVLFIAMPKREYFETIVTKSVELGATKIVPFVSKFSVNHNFKRERIEQIILTACKQCERSRLVEVTSVINFDDMLTYLNGFDCAVFANERETKEFNIANLKNLNKIAIVVGCEGGFDADEIEKIIKAGATSISLGKRILRCDTAVLTTLAVVNVLSGN